MAHFNRKMALNGHYLSTQFFFSRLLPTNVLGCPIEIMLLIKAILQLYVYHRVTEA